MTLLRTLILFTLLTTTAHAALLPGFRVETIARAPGFVSSVVTDSKGTIYFSTTDGWIHRVDGSGTTMVASLPTQAGGNGGLLGIALVDDDTAVVHYTTWSSNNVELARVLDDVVSRVDLHTGAEVILHAFPCDINKRANGASSEHHGGNLTVAPDGSIFLGIGEYGGFAIAQKPAWNGGKIWRIDRDGNTTQWALGLRNPYDLAWDPDLQRVVISDNGPTSGDEINVVAEGDNLGWPGTFGHATPIEGAVPPVYVFPQIVAPTGLLRLSGRNDMLRRGYLVTTFVSRAVYYFPSITAQGVSGPIAVAEQFGEFIIDVTEEPDGDIILATASGEGSAIQRLRIPARGDCNGDGFTDWRDVYPLIQEIEDGGPMIRAQEGSYSGSWGCDADSDGAIDAGDLGALTRMITGRRRSVEHR